MMIELAIGVDGQAVSSFGCDGLVMSTPTGSTAYAFSGGGPVIWPEVEALLLVLLAAHALFTRPLVLGPDNCLEVVIQYTGFGGAEIWCDGQRSQLVGAGSRIRDGYEKMLVVMTRPVSYRKRRQIGRASCRERV